MRRPVSGLTAASLLAGAFAVGCSGQPTEPTNALTFSFDFSRGPQGFVAGFSDYPPAHADFYELTSDYRALPPPLEPRSALSFDARSMRCTVSAMPCSFSMSTSSSACRRRESQAARAAPPDGARSS